ncbi:MAG: HDIG domain-containing protein [Desulfobacterales bacterium]|nr:HDIG domain-containing protein [Desulfobacterales bacterium]
MNTDKTKSISSLQKFLSSTHYIPWLVFIILTLAFAIMLNPNLVTIQHSYKSGDVAEKDIKAPIDFLVEDKAATISNRKDAVEEVLTLYDHDVRLSARISEQINSAFYELQTIFDAEITINQMDGKPVNDLATNPVLQSIHEQIWKMKDNFEKKLGIPVSTGAYLILEKEKFSNEIASLIIRILTTILDNGVVLNKDILLKDNDKGIILRTLDSKIESIVLNLKRFYGLDQAKSMVRVVGQPLIKDLNYNLANLIVDFCQRLIQPNITLNLSETEERKKIAFEEVKNVFYKIKKGEMLLREGERISELQLLKLNAMQSELKNQTVFTSSVGATLIFICLIITTYYFHLKDQSTIVKERNKNLIFIGSVFFIFLIIPKLFIPLSESISQMFFIVIPIASASMTICLFMGANTAVPFIMVLSISVAILLGNRLEILLFFLLTGIMAAYWIKNCRDRHAFIKAGGKLALLNIWLAIVFDIYIGGFSNLNLLWDIGGGFLGGIAAGVITAGLAPLVEIAFDYTTDIKLLELANIDSPILKRLMIEAPGTYHHSVVVGSMAEAAALEIGANPLITKVCGYYHDIGKLKQPLYFIENQTGYRNKHDKLAPSMSSLILIAHVKNGVEIAKEYKLGKAITDTIHQHHGNSLIRYFYDKAKQKKGDDGVNIEDFRYPGPKPKTREAAVVMLSDIVEAASRTLDNPTPARIQGLVQNLISKTFSDGQLDDCELTLRDLHGIAKCFNKILNGIHHHRIEYDKGNGGKAKDGNSDRQPAKQVSDKPIQNSGRSKSALKRLGLS